MGALRNSTTARFTHDGEVQELAPIGADDLKVFESAAIKARFEQVAAVTKAASTKCVAAAVIADFGLLVLLLPDARANR